MQTAQTADDLRWPSTDAAFAFVLPSYQFLLSRLEAADNRLTLLLSTLCAVALGAPAFAVRFDRLSFGSPWFVLGELLYLAAMWYGLLQRIKGVIVLPDPAVLYQKSLNLPVGQFKRDQIYLAGQHFNANAEADNRKGTSANHLTIALIADVLLFVFWIVSAS